MKRTQQQICADLIRRAQMMERSAALVKHTKANKIALQVAARALRVAAEQNSVEWVSP
jgi:hypothetical protein